MHAERSQRCSKVRHQSQSTPQSSPGAVSGQTCSYCGLMHDILQTWPVDYRSFLQGAPYGKVFARQLRKQPSPLRSLLMLGQGSLPGPHSAHSPSSFQFGGRCFGRTQFRRDIIIAEKGIHHGLQGFMRYVTKWHSQCIKERRKQFESRQ